MLPALLAAGAAVALVVWLVMLLAVARRTRSPAIVAGPATMELGPEFPAVVDLITGGWRVDDDAVAATLLDLAARNVVQIETVGPDLSLVRLHPRAAVAELAPHERLVHDHVARLAHDGVVATGALAEGSRDLARWWRRFRKSVIAQAREAGLSELRFRSGHALLLWGTALALAALIGAAVEVVLTDTGIYELDPEEDPGGVALLAGCAVLAAVGWVLRRLNGERGTAAGARAAGSWLGVREHLAVNGSFAEKPAAAVTIWGRHLAYAAAMGLASRAVDSLPVTKPACHRRAWSAHTGMWRQVEIDYPPQLVRGWGDILRRLWASVVLGGLLYGWWFLETAVATDEPADGLRVGWLPGDGADGISVAWLVVAAAVGVLWLSTLGQLVSRARLWRSLPSRTEIEGLVLRRRAQTGRGSPRRRARDRSRGTEVVAHWVALDDGHHSEVRALRITPEAWQSVHEGDVVRARIGRRRGWVGEVEVLHPSRAREGAPVADTGVDRIDAPEHLGELASRLLGGGRRDTSPRRRPG